MKVAGYMFAIVLLIGLAGFGVHARLVAPRSSELLDPATPDSTHLHPTAPDPTIADAYVAVAAAVEAREALDEPSDPASVPVTAGFGVPAGTRAAGSDESEPDPERPRWSSRGRRVNRWPGPIPTPADWRLPDGPVRIGLQAGHWKANEAPDELSGIRGNGTRWGEMMEWQANLEIARRAGVMLEELGYVVDILPAVVPQSYRAHLFISIHADGSSDSKMSGFRIAAPRSDPTGRAAGFVELLQQRYGEATGLPRIPAVTRRMQSYYAFNFRRYEHALHPLTIGVILETGFLTSAGDRRVIVEDPDRAARGIVEAVKAFGVTALAQITPLPAEGGV